VNPLAMLDKVPAPVVAAAFSLVRLIWDVAQASGDSKAIEEALMRTAEDAKAALDAHRFG
jgi:hypothetical protein